MRRLVLATALIAVSCGGSPTMPSSPEPPPIPPPRAVTLNSGPYVLAIGMSTNGTTTCQNGICITVTFCVGVAEPVNAVFDAHVDRSGDIATVTVPGDAASLMLTLQVVGNQAVTGTVNGSARDSRGVAIDARGSLTGAAPANQAIAVSGNIDGSVSGSGGGCSSNSHTWSLTPR